MGKRHNTLSDDIFRNSRYIKTLELELEIDDFRKDYKEQYDIMLDVYKTLIAINNILFADSNKSKKDKQNEISDTLANIVYRSIDDDRNKYSMRTVKALIDSNTRHLYNKFIEWNDSIYQDYYFDTLKQEVEEEMTRLENVGFDNVVKDSLYYEKNKNSDYKIYISKLGNLYASNQAIKSQYKSDFSNNYGIDLSDEEMHEIAFIFDLVACANNGITNTLLNTEKYDFNLGEFSSSEEYYKAYLTALHIDMKDDKLFKENSEAFLDSLIAMSKKLSSDMPLDDFISNFDLYYFLLNMKEIANGTHELKIKTDLINKLVNDLKEIYNIMENTTEEEKQADYKKAFDKVQAIIERNKKLFERLS